MINLKNHATNKLFSSCCFLRRESAPTLDRFFFLIQFFRMEKLKQKRRKNEERFYTH